MAAKGRPAADDELVREPDDWQQPSNVTSVSATTTATAAATTTLTTTTTNTTTTLAETATAGLAKDTTEATTLDEGQVELVDKLGASEQQQQPPPPPPPTNAEETIRHLRRQLELRDRELRALKSEIERYKLVLRQQQYDNKTAQDNDFIQDHLAAGTRRKPSSPSSSSLRFKNDNISLVKHELEDDIIQKVAQIDLNQMSLNDDDDGHVESNKLGKVVLEPEDSNVRPSILEDVKKVIEEDEVELKGDKEEDEEGGGSEEDGLLLTSLTDAAISNLSQLAALQERCESQKQHSTSKGPHSSKKQEKLATSSSTTTSKQAGNKYKPTTTAVANTSPMVAHRDRLDLATPSPSPVSSTGLSHDADNDHDIGDSAVGDIDDDPYSLANQAALAISASNHHHLSDSISPHNLNQTQSLASVVAAAAVAAAAANDHHQHLLQHHQQRTSPHQTRLIPSAMASPDFYHSLHQHQSASSLPYSPSTSAITTPSLTSLMSAHQHQQRRSISNASSNLVLSAIASPSFLRRQYMADGNIPIMSPSPTSLTTGSQSVSAASSSLAHLLQHHHHHHHPVHPHLQQSPHYNPQQQRSASALGVVGPLSSVVAAAAVAAAAASSASVSPPGTGSAAVSPLMSNKNSTQARLNNMQIRHKFGYLGSGRAQFNSPHGFCLGLNQEIVVADTNNHRICIFDKSGTYITQFGSPGKEEGQLWNPRKVAILHKPSILAQYYKQLEAKAREAANEAGSGGEGSGGSNSNNNNSTSSNNNNNNNNSNSSSSSSSIDQANQQQHVTTHHYPQQHHLHHHQHLYPSHHLSHQTNLHHHQSNNQQSATATTNQAVGIGEPLFVVCDRGAERSRMQLFTKDGAFIKKISIHFIDIVAGLAITQNGLIIVVDSVSPTVYIINGETGVLNGWFDCSGHMKEPSDIAVKSDVPRNEYFICDFKGHCVVVFSESGEYLRKIGHDGLTSYPNGIDISDDGDILVGDSHGNRFHVVVFDRNGNFVSQFECPHVKVSRCCGLKITREGYIVTLAKNNHHVLVLDTIHI